MELFEIIDMIFRLVWTTFFFVFCIVVGFTEFHRIYPIRYGRKHIELKGKVVREDDMRMRFGRIAKVPVVQFIWKENSYEIADRIHYFFEEYEVGYEKGDNVIVCYNPSKNQDAVIIKGRTFDSKTIMPWLMWFIAAFCSYIILLALLLLVI